MGGGVKPQPPCRSVPVIQLGVETRTKLSQAITSVVIDSIYAKGKKEVSLS